jgi:hypothetical protein
MYMSCDNGQDHTSLVDHEESAAEVRAALDGLRRPAIPRELTHQLRVIASHERQRRLRRLSVAAFLRFWLTQMQLAFDNMMKPLAVPVAGGSLSAVALFAMLVPSLSFPRNFDDGTLFTYPAGTIVVMGSSGEYVPSPVADSPRIVPMSEASYDASTNVVELTIDEKGRVSDYSIWSGHLTPDFKDIIMFSEFTPATFLGTPTSAKVRIVQRPAARRRNMRS